MVYTQSYQIYKYEHGLSAAEQRASDVRAGEAAAALRDLRLRLGRALRPRHRVRPARRTAGMVRPMPHTGKCERSASRA